MQYFSDALVISDTLAVIAQQNYSASLLDRECIRFEGIVFSTNFLARRKCV